MTETAPTYRYDLFFVCAGADRAFVQRELLPRLGWPAERILLLGDFTPGASMSDEVERGVSQSRFTLVVLSRAFLSDRWATFGEQLASYSNTMRGRLVPILREPCDVPVRLQFLVALDYSDPAQREAEDLRLRRLLGAETPAAVEPDSVSRREVPPPPEPGDGKGSATAAPRSRGRRGVILGAVILLAAVGAVALRPHLAPPSADGGAPSRVDAAAAPAPLVVAGAVVDGRTNRAVGQVRVEVQDSGVSTITDDAGNFRMLVPRSSPAEQRRLVRASRPGYAATERWILPPLEDLTLPLRKE